MSLKPSFQLSSFAILAALVIFAVDRLNTQSDLGQIITGSMVALTIYVYSRLVDSQADHLSE